MSKTNNAPQGAKPAATPEATRTITAGMAFLVAIFAIFIFFNLTGLGTAATVSYAFIVFGFVAMCLMPRYLPKDEAADAAMPTTTKFLGGSSTRITTTYFLIELVVAACFISLWNSETMLFAFFVQTGLFVVYLSYAIYQSNTATKNTPEARAQTRAQTRGKSRGVQKMPQILSQARGLEARAKGTRYEKVAHSIAVKLTHGPKESFEGTLDLEEQIAGFLFEFDTLLKEQGDAELMDDCARLLPALIDQRNELCK